MYSGCTAAPRNVGAIVHHNCGSRTLRFAKCTPDERSERSIRQTRLANLHHVNARCSGLRRAGDRRAPAFLAFACGRSGGHEDNRRTREPGHSVIGLNGGSCRRFSGGSAIERPAELGQPRQCGYESHARYSAARDRTAEQLGELRNTFDEKVAIPKPGPRRHDENQPGFQKIGSEQQARDERNDQPPDIPTRRSVRAATSR